MNNLTINPKTGKYGVQSDFECGKSIYHVTNHFIPQFNITNEYVGMMEFGRFFSKEYYIKEWATHRDW